MADSGEQIVKIKVHKQKRNTIQFLTMKGRIKHGFSVSHVFYIYTSLFACLNHGAEEWHWNCKVVQHGSD